ncbi:unnamed protein product, partial [Vitis vinifera]
MLQRTSWLFLAENGRLRNLESTVKIFWS